MTFDDFKPIAPGWQYAYLVAGSYEFRDIVGWGLTAEGWKPVGFMRGELAALAGGEVLSAVR